MRKLLPLALALLLLGATACGDDNTTSAGGSSTGPSGSPGKPGKAGPLVGRTFVSATVTEGGKPRPLAPKTELSIAVQPDGSLTADAGCNHMFGQAQVAGGRITVKGLGSTEMACDPLRMAQEAWFGTFLTSGPAYSLDGDTLTLTVKGTVVTFTDKATAHPGRPLEGTTWQLDGFTGATTASSMPAGTSATLRIAGGKLSFTNRGCNGGGSDVRVGDATMTVQPMITTKMACDPGPAEVESRVVTVLAGSVSYAIDGDRLTLTRGGHGLTLVATG